LSRRFRSACTALAVAVALVVALPGCGGGDDDGGAAPAASENARVELREITFIPSTVAVFTGGTVTWVWNDGNTRHNVVGDDFESDLVAEGTFRHTFDAPGTYDYVCTIHPSMKGKVVVTDR
jgi:plastocyanin